MAARKAELEEELLALLSAEAQSMEECLLEDVDEEEGDESEDEGGQGASSDGESQEAEEFAGGAWGLGSGEDGEEEEGSVRLDEERAVDGTAGMDPAAAADESSSETAAGSLGEGLVAQLQSLAVVGTVA